ncbi:hypothetical protein EON63_01375 [archaeon]|nr:MAG: hypothetical protein EON63_01375 [archaeon]
MWALGWMKPWWPAQDISTTLQAAFDFVSNSSCWQEKAVFLDKLPATSCFLHPASQTIFPFDDAITSSFYPMVDKQFILSNQSQLLGKLTLYMHMCMLCLLHGSVYTYVCCVFVVMACSCMVCVCMVGVHGVCMVRACSMHSIVPLVYKDDVENNFLSMSCQCTIPYRQVYMCASILREPTRPSSGFGSRWHPRCLSIQLQHFLHTARRLLHMGYCQHADRYAAPI